MVPDNETGDDAIGGEDDEQVRVLVEIRVPQGERAAGLETAEDFDVGGFELDRSYEPVPVETPQDASVDFEGEEVVVVRGTVPREGIDELEAREEVVSVSTDARIEPFGVRTRPEVEPVVEPEYPDFEALSSPPVREREADADLASGETGTCPVSPCDCSPSTPKGDVAAVRRFLGVDEVWERGYRGNGVTVGVVDGGISAKGRTSDGVIPNVAGGWPTDDWGTVARWGEHGNMCATDTLGMAPECELYDLRISDASAVSGTLSDALAGFQWAIDQHRHTGRPDVLTNSWGVYRKSWAPDYATQIGHPFTRKVAQAINEGITVLFAAGNCGEACPSGRCGSDSGPGKSIWGANGHPQVITVGAVNSNDEYVGYSSQGPASLDSFKPDLLSVSHFTGYFDSDTGTSAATPVAAGVMALLEQANRTMSPEEMKSNLKATARDYGPQGWDRHSGQGVIRAAKALDRLVDVGRRDRVYPRDLHVTGTQFESTIEPGGTQRWFTHSWPSEYVAQWSIRPTSPEGRLDWRVDVKRQQDGDLTYFITVENVGSVQTGFEANYLLAR